jgi:hypothetical protein
LTTDHTWIQEAIEKGILSAEHSQDHPNVHVIRRYLGSSQPPKVDLRLRVRSDESDTQAVANQGLLLHPGDLLLLCTDGLTDKMTNAEILALVRGLDPLARSGQALEPAAQALIDLANARGGHDNIIVVLLAVPGKPEGMKRSLWPWLIGGLAVFLVFTVALGGLLWLVSHPTPTATSTGVQTTVSTPLLPGTLPALQPDLSSSPLPPGLNVPTYTPWPTNTP